MMLYKRYLLSLVEIIFHKVCSNGNSGNIYKAWLINVETNHIQDISVNKPRPRRFKKHNILSSVNVFFKIIIKANRKVLTIMLKE